MKPLSYSADPSTPLRSAQDDRVAVIRVIRLRHSYFVILFHLWHTKRQRVEACTRTLNSH